MEIIIIFTLIAGLLIGWFLMMREEVVGLILRAVLAIRAKYGTQSASLPNPLAVEPCRTAAGSDSAAAENEIQRKSRDTEGGIPTWTIGG